MITYCIILYDCIIALYYIVLHIVAYNNCRDLIGYFPAGRVRITDIHKQMTTIAINNNYK